MSDASYVHVGCDEATLVAPHLPDDAGAARQHKAARQRRLQRVEEYLALAVHHVTLVGLVVEVVLILRVVEMAATVARMLAGVRRGQTEL